MRATDYQKLKAKILALESQVAYWQSAYYEAIKHDGRVIRDLKEAQDEAPH